AGDPRVAPVDRAGGVEDPGPRLCPGAYCHPVPAQGKGHTQSERDPERSHAPCPSDPAGSHFQDHRADLISRQPYRGDPGAFLRLIDLAARIRRRNASTWERTRLAERGLLAPTKPVTYSPSRAPPRRRGSESPCGRSELSKGE